LTDALSNVTSNTTEIWVVSGTYVPGSNRTSSFVVGVDGLTVYGGFDGTESAVTERDVLSNPTIFSGDVNNDDTGVGMTNTSRNDNTYHVVRITANNITLDGIQINDGHANGSSTNGYAGGVLIADTAENPTFRHCEFNRNVGLTGGAIRVNINVNTSMTFENCTFYNNVSRYGSGIYFLVNNNRTVTLNVTNCLFYQNISTDLNATDEGFTGSSMWIRANGSGANLTSTITNCTFGNNLDRGSRADSEKGTLAFSRRTDGTSTHNATINNSIFYYNDQGVSGATGVSVNRGHTSYPNAVFVNNSISEDAFSNLSFLTNTSSADPLFTDSNMDDFTLQSGSPAIDSGNNSQVPAGITADLLFNQRIHNTTVDMGVYEFGAPPILSIGDFQQNENPVTVYPNPVKGLLHVATIQMPKSISVYNSNGQQVLQVSNTDELNFSTIPSGLYIVKIVTDRNTQTVKVLKK
ncbi:DUF5123 domain-containing protein, partial [Kordia sp. TARA_039_SRF]